MDEGYYQVESIIGKKFSKGVLFYKVKWKGYSIGDSTWEPLDNLSNVKDLVEEFENRNTKENRLTGRKRIKSEIIEISSDSDSDSEAAAERDSIQIQVEHENTNKIRNKGNNIINSKLLPVYGKFSTDRAKRIVHGKPINEAEKLIKCEIEWYPRDDGVKPLNSFYTNKDLKALNPHLLCDFYEERLKTPKSLLNSD